MLSKNRLIRIAIGLVFVTVGLVLIFRKPLPEPAPVQIDPSETPVKAAPSLSGGRSGGPAGRPSVSIAQLCAGQPPPAVPASALRPLLEKNPGNPLYHAAAVDVSGDMALLRESLRQWPDSVDLLLRGMNLEFTPEARAACARGLIRIEPGNAGGHYGLAAFYAEAGNRPAMLKSLRDGVACAAPQSETPEMTPLRMEAWRAAGYLKAEAEIYSSCSTANHLQHNRTLLRPVSTLRDLLAELPAGDEREETAMLGVACAEHLRQTDGVALNLMVMSVQMAFLQEIDPEAAFGETGNTVSQQQKLVERELAAVKEEFSRMEQRPGSISEEDFLNPYNTWMALAEYNAYQRLPAPGQGRGQ